MDLHGVAGGDGWGEKLPGVVSPAAVGTVFVLWFAMSDACQGSIALPYGVVTTDSGRSVFHRNDSPGGGVDWTEDLSERRLQRLSFGVPPDANGSLLSSTRRGISERGIEKVLPSVLWGSSARWGGMSLLFAM